MTRARLEVTITGRVQGVFFRQSTMDTANRYSLTGWVKNCSDGSVAAIFEGERKDIEAALEWCRRGPSGARVENVVEQWSACRDEFARFDVRR